MLDHNKAKSILANRLLKLENVTIQEYNDVDIFICKYSSLLGGST